MKIKICGITRKEDALKALELGAWAVGFIFYKKSPRYITPEKAGEIISVLPEGIKKIGVFVNSSAEEIIFTGKISGITTYQLHGDESPEFCKKLDKEVIKAIRPKKKHELEFLKNYTNISAFLVDSYVSGEFGGSGQKGDWELAKKVKKYGTLILAGGINSDNISEAIQIVSPFAIDLSSSVEDTPGIKSHEKMKRLFNLTDILKE